MRREKKWVNFEFPSIFFIFFDSTFILIPFNIHSSTFLIWVAEFMTNSPKSKEEVRYVIRLVNQFHCSSSSSSLCNREIRVFFRCWPKSKLFQPYFACVILSTFLLFFVNEMLTNYMCWTLLLSFLCEHCLCVKFELKVCVEHYCCCCHLFSVKLS